MKKVREGIEVFGGKKVVTSVDYANAVDGLPQADVLKFVLEDNCSVVIRPSGTEPKLKAYVSVCAESKVDADNIEQKIKKDLHNLFEVA